MDHLFSFTLVKVYRDALSTAWFLAFFCIRFSSLLTLIRLLKYSWFSKGNLDFLLPKIFEVWKHPQQTGLWGKWSLGELSTNVQSPAVNIKKSGWGGSQKKSMRISHLICGKSDDRAAFLEIRPKLPFWDREVWECIERLAKMSGWLNKH